MAKREDRCGHKNGCTHRSTQHRDADPRRGLPAMCTVCKHGKGAHAFVAREAAA